MSTLTATRGRPPMKDSCLRGHAYPEFRGKSGCVQCNRDSANRYQRENVAAVRPSKARSALAARTGQGEDDRAYVAILKGDPCCYCGAPMTDVDHIDPTSLGGPDGWENLTAACRSCNARKQNDRLLFALLRMATPSKRRRRT